MGAKEKTASQRLRATLYKVWETNKEGFDEFEAYYQNKMEVIIIHFQGKIR